MRAILPSIVVPALYAAVRGEEELASLGLLGEPLVFSDVDRLPLEPRVALNAPLKFRIIREE